MLGVLEGEERRGGSRLLMLFLGWRELCLENSVSSRYSNLILTLIAPCRIMICISVSLR
jgi:hypothetical protein